MLSSLDCFGAEETAFKPKKIFSPIAGSFLNSCHLRIHDRLHLAWLGKTREGLSVRFFQNHKKSKTSGLWRCWIRVFFQTAVDDFLFFISTLKNTYHCFIELNQIPLYCVLEQDLSFRLHIFDPDEPMHHLTRITLNKCHSEIFLRVRKVKLH